MQLFTKGGIGYTVDDKWVETISKFGWSPNAYGYIRHNYIPFKGKQHNVFLHQFIYWLEYGEIGTRGKLEIDHIDRDKTNNSILNLRLVTPSVNLSNRGRNTQGYKGKHKLPKYITYDSRRGHYIVKSKLSGYHGGYSTLKEAKIVRDKKINLLTGELL